MDYSIIVPVYNGEFTVKPLMESIHSFFRQTKYRYEVIFVYDCGPDRSWDVLLTLKSEYPDCIKLIRLSRNYGQHNALICGFTHADGDYIITIDEDLQYDPADIQLLIDKQKENDYDVVYGKQDELKHNRFRNLTSQIFKKMVIKGIPDLCRDYSAFRLIRKDIAKATVLMHNSYTFIDGYLSWITQHYGSCTVSHKERLAGKSSYTTSKLIEHSINIFVTFSNYPIRLLTRFSVCLFIFSLFYAIYVIIRKLIYDDFAAGYATVVIVAGMGISLVLLGLGIIGEYIYRINLKTTKRPNYNIEKLIV